MFKYRNTVFPLVMLALFLLFKPVLAGGNAASDFQYDLAGLMVSSLGQLLRVMVIGLVYIKRGGFKKRVYAEQLVTEGIFAHVRNPLYLGNLLILAGLFIIENNPWAYVIGGLFFICAYKSLVVAEEAFLLQKFPGSYREYCGRVNRWLPEFHGLAETLHCAKFNWRRVLLKDYSSCYTWVMTALALLYYEAAAYRGLRLPGPRAHGLLAAAAIASAIFLVVRYLKKSRTMRA